MRPVPKPKQTFVASYGAIKIRVRVLATVEDVTNSFRKEWGDAEEEAPPDDMMIYSFFVDALHNRRGFTGTIYLAENSRLFELVPHEVYHAIRHHWATNQLEDDEERFARALGCLVARILTHLDNGE